MPLWFDDLVDFTWVGPRHRFPGCLEERDSSGDQSPISARSGRQSRTVHLRWVAPGRGRGKAVWSARRAKSWWGNYARRRAERVSCCACRRSCAPNSGP